MTPDRMGPTPGPWMFYAQPHGCDIYERASFGKGEIVASMAGDSASFEANARLISAAPDLLAALKIAARYFHENGGNEAYTWLWEIDSAIAKAEGHHE